MLIEAFGHPENASATDLQEPVAFDLHLRLENEVLLSDRRQAVSRTMARQAARPAHELGRQRDDAIVMRHWRTPVTMTELGRNRILAAPVRCPELIASDDGKRGGTMGGFIAEPRVISAFGEELDGLVAEANAAKGYAEDHLNLSGGDAGIFQTIVGAVTDARNALTENYERLAGIAQAAASEVDKAAMMYGNTDKAEAERMDSTYPEAGA
ncbi:type VII secretion target [Prauserella muralis]|uniref:type VII secretion target n=1 Tax=Prauserella muralis TaxID=588067 RepID=UPI001FE49357|nr:type VII secretion target [Prauserella muralis]